MKAALTRRSFLKVAGVSGGGLVLGVSLSGCSSAPALAPEHDVVAFDAFLQITADNEIRFYCPRDEMGQGISTGLTTLVAEELDVNPMQIDVRLAGVHPDYKNPEFGVQGTGGSTSIKVHYLPLRQVAADARALLRQAAARAYAVDVADVGTDNGMLVINGERHPYGQFAADACLLTLDEPAPLKAASDFQYIGSDFGRVDAIEKSTGTAVYGIDVDVPGMRYAVMQHAPVVGAEAVSYNEAEVSTMPGVDSVHRLSTGVAVVAERYWQAKKAAAALKVEWSEPEQAQINSTQVRADYEAAMQQEEGHVDEERGDLTAGFEQADVVLENQYWAPYLAHAPMEPMNAVVRINQDSADVWSGTQMPEGMRGLVARHSGLSASQVTVHRVAMGGAFGRRSYLSHVIEATQLAKATQTPIKLVWSRESDTQNGVYRPASLMRLKAGVTQEGQITAWTAKRVGGNINPDMVRSVLPGLAPPIISQGVTDFIADTVEGLNDGWLVDSASVEGLAENYDFPNRSVHHVTVNHGLPLMYWRSVGHSFTAFAKETLMDELAEKAGMAPDAFRLANLNSNPRLANVVRLAGEVMHATPVLEGRAVGLSAHGSFDTDVAQLAEVSIEANRIKVHKVVCVLDCGQAINPDIIKAQVEGSIMYGLTAALYGDIHLENGAVVESNFHNYPILRMDEAPEVEVVIVPTDAPPTGVGEPALPPIAPAVANAVYRLTGQRLRSLPLKLA